MNMKLPELSIIIPVLNEQGNIEIQNSKIKKSLVGKFDYEVIWIDDGSTDDTPDIIDKISKEDSRVKGLTLMRRVGQSGALMAGIEMASGKYIAIMDGDNQNDPDEFVKMYEKLINDNLDVVVGWRKQRWQGNFLRRIPSLLANFMIQSSFRTVSIHDAGCPIKLGKATVLKNIRLYGELHRFLSYILHSHGARLGEVEIKHRERKSGQSKYGIGRTFTVIFDILNLKFLFMRKRTPIQVFGPIGLLLFLTSFLFALYLIYEKLFGVIDVSASPYFILSVISLVMGTQFLTFGLLGELIIRSYYENGMDKKTYAIRKTY